MRTLEQVRVLALASQHGRSVYVLGYGVATFARDSTTGELRQLPRATGCVE